MSGERPREDEPIRTVLFTTLYPSSARPVNGIFVEARLRHLLATGEVQSSVVAPVPWFPSRNPRYGRWARMAATPRKESRHGIEVWHPRYVLPPKLGMSIAPLMLALGARPTITRLLRTGVRFDLFDAHYYYPDGAAAALLSRWFGKPFVITGRGSDLNLLPDYPIPRRWIKWTETQAAASILVSRALMRHLAALGGDPERMRVLPNGVDLELFRPLDRQQCRQQLALPDGRWMLAVGHLVKLKGYEIAIEALRHLPADVRLAVIGDGDERESLRMLCERLGVSNRVKWVGAVEQAALTEWYNAADVLVLCSSREGSPNVVLEALACGTPVAATSVGGVPELIGSPVAGRLIADRTAASLASAVLDVLSASIRREDTRAYAMKFGWPATTRGQIDLFRSVLNRSAQR